MSEYQVIARKFRPQSFKRVLGQEAIVTTLKNAIKFKRLAQAYLFCGSRGTGKTTLARIFAKALNCYQPLDGEPCEICTSCREITQGSSLDVIEIDGASNRGIDDIRQINETVGYAATSGGYKIYIIDEVHMLTKEAFNALLKTLEEPPAKVKFFFATTEPHKVLPTILSRCQRFNLSRIPLAQIVQKLTWVAQELHIEVEEAALVRLAQRAEGGLRDAESLFDQVIAFTDGRLTVQDVDAILGLMPRETFFELDQAIKDTHLAKAFEIAHHIFAEGKDLVHFIDGLIEHFRTILLIKLSGQDSTFLVLNSLDKEKYTSAARFYTQEQCLELISYLVESQQQARAASFNKIKLEAILLHVLQSRYRLTIGQLVTRLHQLEQSFENDERKKIESETVVDMTSIHASQTAISPPFSAPIAQSQVVVPDIEPEIAPPIFSKVEPKPEPTQSLTADSSISEDPTPLSTDFDKKSKLKSPTLKTTPITIPAAPLVANKEIKEVEKKPVILPENSPIRPAHEYDTLLQFAAVELDGKLQRHS